MFAHPHRLWYAALALLVQLAGNAALAQDDPPGRVGRIASISGEAWIFDHEQGEWVQALRNRPVTGGDRLSTSPGAWVELSVGSTTLQIGGSAELAALRLDDQQMQWSLQRGQMALRVRSREAAAETEVLNVEGRFAPQRPGLYRIDRQDDATEATVIRGELKFDARDLELTLHAGQRVRIWQTGALAITASQWLAPPDDEFARFVQSADAAEQRSASLQFVPPEMTGVEDLDRHGRWQQHPEFGAVWSPTVVAVGWAPYRHGRWVWLRPWGWTWVDDAAWGFAPFHYGRWFFWGTRWCWAPGPIVPRPVFAPALVGWLGAPHGRHPPGVGWVPLAPREQFRPAYRSSPGYLNRVNPHAPNMAGTAPAYGNRHVPGAVTVLPTAHIAPHQPVAAAALRADDSALRRQWQAEHFHQQAPQRPIVPPRREIAAPRSAPPAREPAAPAPVQAAAPQVAAAPPAWPQAAARQALPAPAVQQTAAPQAAPASPLPQAEMPAPAAARPASPHPVNPAPAHAAIRPAAPPLSVLQPVGPAAPAPAAMTKAVPAAMPHTAPAAAAIPQAVPAAMPQTTPAAAAAPPVAAARPLPPTAPQAQREHSTPAAPATPPRPMPAAPAGTFGAAPRAPNGVAAASPPAQAAAPPAAVPVAPAAVAPPAAAKPAPARAEPGSGRDGHDPGERRRTPESRGKGPER